MADLAVRLINRIIMPVAHGLRGQHGDKQHHNNCQQAFCGASRHRKIAYPNANDPILNAIPGASPVFTNMPIVLP
jgi:hypothetical protein